MTWTLPLSTPMCGDLPDDQRLRSATMLATLTWGMGEGKHSCVSPPRAQRRVVAQLSVVTSRGYGLCALLWVGHKATPVRRFDQGDCEAVPLAWCFVGCDKCLKG